MRTLSQIITDLRFKYHANMIGVVHAAWKNNIIDDDVAENANRRHTMIIFEELLPKMTGLSVEEILKQAKKKGW